MENGLNKKEQKELRISAYTMTIREEILLATPRS